MKTSHLSILCIFALLSSEVLGMDWKPAKLRVDDIKPERGGLLSIYVFLEDGFPIKHAKAIKNYTVPAKTRSMDIEIRVPDQPFAIKVYHDEDSSGAVTKDWTGFIPAEGLGFSSGASIGFTGPPPFSDAVIKTYNTGQISIRMLYP